MAPDAAATPPTIEVTTSRRRLGCGDCPFCRRHVPLTFHHLIPRKVHRRRTFQKGFSKALLGRGVAVCRDCHDGIHDRYDEMRLAREFATPEALAADTDLQRHFAWVARQRRQRVERG
ncbi:MAG: hypothetical protein RIC56_10095 [Pseudomonadales bacterium]